MTFGLIENARNPLVSVSTGVFYLFLLQNSGIFYYHNENIREPL